MNPTPSNPGVFGKRVTLGDVARRCAVSLQSVSLALRNQGSLAAGTRARIKAAAAELGYAPDPVLSALVHYRQRKRRTFASATLAYLTNHPTGDGWRPHYFFQQAWLGAAERAARLGYRLEHFWMADPKLGPARLATILVTRGIRGLVIAPLPRGAGRLSFPWERFSAVAFGPSLVSPVLHAAMANHYQAMQLAWDNLWAAGYRRIGFVLDEASHLRLCGRYLAAYAIKQAERLPSRKHVPVLREAIPSQPRLAAWLRDHRPDVVLYHDDRLVDRLRELGLSVPADIPFASLGRLNRPEIAGVDQSAAVIGAAAINRLDLLLRDNEVGVPERPLNFVVDGVWIAGQTVPQPKKRLART